MLTMLLKMEPETWKNIGVLFKLRNTQVLIRIVNTVEHFFFFFTNK